MIMENVNVVGAPSLDEVREWMYHSGCRNQDEADKFFYYYESKRLDGRSGANDQLEGSSSFLD